MESEYELLFPRKPPFCSMFKVSIIIPTYNSAQFIAATLESALSQKNCKIEIIVVDGNSSDRTVEIVHSYEDPRIKIQRVPSNKIFEMVNRGIALAQGEYVNILRPGDTYFYPSAIALAMWQIAQNGFPELFYSASFIRDEWYVPHFLFRPLKRELLRRGLQPTNLQSCWIKKEVFKDIGLFDPSLEVRGSFDFFARFLHAGKSLRVASEVRAYVDPIIISYTYPYLIQLFKETFYEIRRYYGLMWAIMWLFQQNYLKRLARKVFHRVQFALTGK